MDVFNLSAHQIEVRLLVGELLLEGPVLLLGETCERLLVDKGHMKLHHEPIDQMD